ncbi:MAG TPA: UbiA family prenyltransferase [Verrucomicrobiae bacterium]|jgi:4-hydroxybenzoate polyprenyltransferase|nr:UbiA family prenyltransferase [Verrucomicrobiae bacterium]
MEPLTLSAREYLRTLLVLGRASNLPTVWSNCLAGWILAGDGPLSGFFLLCLGATCLYLGGMYLNDAFDADFDRQHRSERPIPSGAITLGEVWGFGIGWLVLGTVLLAFFGVTTFFLTVLLVTSIIAYDAVHKAIALSPVLMALCRFFLFLVAASSGDEGVTGLAIWSAFALAFYIIGLSYVAKSESTRGPLRYWPCWFLAPPLLLAYLVNQGDYKKRSLTLGAILLLWIVRNLRFAFVPAEKSIGRCVSGLLAGIVLVDLLAVAGGTSWVGLIFVLLFAGALLFQRFIPAT